MRVAVVNAIAVFALISAPLSSLACAPIDYGTMSFPHGSATTQLVSRAAAIEVMQVEGRRLAADRGIPEYGPAYEFTLRPVRTLAGRSRGRLRVFALDASAPMAQWSPPQRWWEDQGDGEPRFQFANPFDSFGYGFNGCQGIAAFRLGDTHLVFRDRSGAVLLNAVTLRSSTMGDLTIDGPAFEHVSGADDVWVREVQLAIAEQGPKPVSSWDMVFSLIFGDPRRR